MRERQKIHQKNYFFKNKNVQKKIVIYKIEFSKNYVFPHLQEFSLLLLHFFTKSCTENRNCSGFVKYLSQKCGFIKVLVEEYREN